MCWEWKFRVGKKKKFSSNEKNNHAEGMIFSMSSRLTTENNILSFIEGVKKMNAFS